LEDVMRIGIIGGLDRSESNYVRLAEKLGHELLVHSGHLGGRGAQALEGLLERSDVVVVVTDVNSHGALTLARRRLREVGRTPLLLRKCGFTRFNALLLALTQRERQGTDVWAALAS
jgi:hypothetical protein